MKTKFDIGETVAILAKVTKIGIDPKGHIFYTLKIETSDGTPNGRLTFIHTEEEYRIISADEIISDITEWTEMQNENKI